MAKSDRVWNLRLNLDEFNSLIASVFSDGDRALLLQGLSLGCNGGDLPDGVPPAFMRGWMFGHASRGEAEEFKARQAAKGSASAESRRAKNGTAQPNRTSSNTGSNTGSESVRTASEAILNPQSYNKQTTNDDRPPMVPQGTIALEKTEPASKIVQEAWEDLLDQGYKAVRYKAWSPKMTRQAHDLMKLYKSFDFDDLFRRALAIMGNDQWLRDHPHHFNVQRILRPDIFAMYADKVELPVPLMDELPLEANP